MRAPKALAWSPFDIRREFSSSLRPGVDTVGHISLLKACGNGIPTHGDASAEVRPPSLARGAHGGGSYCRCVGHSPIQGYPGSKCVLTARQSCHFLPLAHDWGLKRALPSK